MHNLTDLLLNGMTTHGSVLLGITLLLGALGTPVPTSLMVVAAGAFAGQGLIDGQSAFVVGLTGAVLGDSISYSLGYFFGSRVEQRFDQSPARHATQQKFERYGELTIYLTRFIFTPLAVPANLIAGGSGYNFRKFLTYDTAGEITWLLLYGGLGYLFGGQWQTASQLVTDYGIYLTGLVIGGMAVYLFVRYWRRGQGVLHKLAPVWALR
jgi:membrane protein DedA with SNARE-associated domain